jgi:hypothetical protein
MTKENQPMWKSTYNGYILRLKNVRVYLTYKSGSLTELSIIDDKSDRPLFMISPEDDFYSRSYWSEYPFKDNSDIIRSSEGIEDATKLLEFFDLLDFAEEKVLGKK